jgi:hypothetical protein
LKKFDEAMLGILFTPTGPPTRPVENIMDDKMDIETITELQSHDGTFIESVSD